MRVVTLSPMWTFLIDVMVWLVIHFGLSYFCYRLPQTVFKKITFPLMSFERSVRFYEHRLKIKKWKAFLPDGSAWFKKGFRKRHLLSTTTHYFETFILESRRAELTHWLCLVFVVVFFFWNDLPSDGIMILYAIVANLPCILVQRYNRLRFLRILSKPLLNKHLFKA